MSIYRKLSALFFFACLSTTIQAELSNKENAPLFEFDWEESNCIYNGDCFIKNGELYYYSDNGMPIKRKSVGGLLNIPIPFEHVDVSHSKSSGKVIEGLKKVNSVIAHIKDKKSQEHFSLYQCVNRAPENNEKTMEDLFESFVKHIDTLGRPDNLSINVRKYIKKCSRNNTIFSNLKESDRVEIKYTFYQDTFNED